MTGEPAERLLASSCALEPVARGLQDLVEPGFRQPELRIHPGDLRNVASHLCGFSFEYTLARVEICIAKLCSHLGKQDVEGSEDTLGPFPRDPASRSRGGDCAAEGDDEVMQINVANSIEGHLFQKHKSFAIYGQTVPV